MTRKSEVRSLRAKLANVTRRLRALGWEAKWVGKIGKQNGKRRG